MTDRDRNIEIARRVMDELFDAGDLDAVDELIHPGFVNHEAGPENPQGREGLKETVAWLRGIWGPMRFEVSDLICEGDKVVARVTVHGRHVGEFLGRPPTGKEYAVEHIHIYRIADGMLIEHWSVRDDLGQSMQLGLFGD
jgi:predicted ester cyclase